MPRPNLAHRILKGVDILVFVKREEEVAVLARSTRDLAVTVLRVLAIDDVHAAAGVSVSWAIHALWRSDVVVLLAHLVA